MPFLTSLEDKDGNAVDESTLKGKIVALYFSSSWCKCDDERKNLRELFLGVCVCLRSGCVCVCNARPWSFWFLIMHITYYILYHMYDL
jgi:hypothetical protein